jgi:serine/threonine-protein kinase
MLADRYRIIALLGKGGMGEVFRAEDLRLGQEVALKFLPEAATNEDSLERFRSEVRIARQISHPNVCRVYDIGESRGQIYLSMEYIDGEDLASLLRRIGRLPSDKAIEIARKICAGLAAAHAKGILHRDLKPANIMINGEGEALIMDFGLAAVAHDVTDVRSGTPAYMAPEQLAGKEVTIKSDIYSLGLVLYELFTGKRAYDGADYEEVTAARRYGTVSRPSTLIRDLDPRIERAILRCLEPEPRDRPASAITVAAALPGGDPLAVALAAGETPSPQLVAAAGDRTGVPVKLAASLFSAVIVSLIVVYVLGLRGSSIDRFDLPYPPQVLSQKARDIMRDLGCSTSYVDSYDDWDIDTALADYVEQKKVPSFTWQDALSGRPGLLRYWRRESPDTLLTLRVNNSSLVPGQIDRSDPPPTISGMCEVMIDTEGRLVGFRVTPPQLDKTPASTTPIDWSNVFRLAGLDEQQFKPVNPQWNPLGNTDSQVAWLGVWPGKSVPLRVEAASWRGKPTCFELIGDWKTPEREVSAERSQKERVVSVIMVVFGTLLLISGTAFAYRNLRRGRIDRPGTLRLALTVFIVQMALCLLRVHFVASPGSFALLIFSISGSLFVAALVCMFYLAIEPFVRHHWPHAIISWTRMLSGKIRDSLVGRDLMIGTLLGILWAITYEVVFLATQRAGGEPSVATTDFLLGARWILGTWLWHLANSVTGTLGFFFVMFVLRLLLRKPWAAALVFVAAWTLLKVFGSHHLDIQIPAQIVIYSLAAIVLLRFGFLSLATGIFTADILLNIPITLHLGAWYSDATIFVFLTVMALSTWGFYTALAGQKIWKDALLD